MNGFKSTIVLYEPKLRLLLNSPIRPKIRVEIIRCGIAREQALHLGESREVTRPHAWLRRSLLRSLAAHLWPHFPSPETTRGIVGTRFQRSDFWDRLRGQALLMIDRWYSRQPLTESQVTLISYPDLTLLIWVRD